MAEHMIILLTRLRRSLAADPGGSPPASSRRSLPACRVTAVSAGYESAGDLAEALRRAAAAHGRHEEEIGQADPDWSDWYAQYMVQQRAAQGTTT